MTQLRLTDRSSSLTRRARYDVTRHTEVRWLNAILILAALIAGECRAGALAGPSPNVSGIYVANSGNNSISIYAPGARGDVAPLRIISGASTGLSNPWGVTLDAAGYLYVANSNSITVYSPGAGGLPGSSAANIAPVRTISGIGTGLNGPIGLALDGAGYLYVSNASALTITVYAPIVGGQPSSLTAYVAPVRQILGVVDPRGVALDPSGTLYVANAMSPYRSGGGSIDIYAPSAGGLLGTSAASAAALRTINGPGTGLNQPSGLALDGTRNLYVSNDSSITVYAPDTGGFRDSPKANVAPIRTINGASTRLSNPWGWPLMPPVMST